jgi:acyl carrier protein
MNQQICAEVTAFVVANYLFGDASRVPGESDSLVEEGIIDSTGILELIEFLESQYDIEVTESETIPANLGSIAALVSFVERKRSAMQAIA